MLTGSGSTLEEILPGIQLAVFETLWAAEPRLNRIAFLADENRLDIFFEWSSEPSEEDREGAEYPMQEVLDVAFLKGRNAALALNRVRLLLRTIAIS